MLLMGKSESFDLMIKPVIFSDRDISDSSDEITQHIFSEDYLDLDQCCEIYERMKKKGFFRLFTTEIMMKLKIPSV